MNEENLVNYYNKFNEDKRLKTRHGKIEFITNMKYIHELLNKFENPNILDIGAGTGAYSIPLSDEGFNVTAVELVKHNLKVIEKKNKTIKVIQGNATNLSTLKSNSYDVILLFGPMYHLINNDEKIESLNEAKRLVKSNGVILIQYIMNEYAIIRHGFMERAIIDAKTNNLIDDDYHVLSDKDNLYSYVRLEDIDFYNKVLNFERIKIVSSDTVANYFREYVNKLSDEEFEEFIRYHLSICERKDILGLCGHILDIVKVKK